MDQVDLTLTPTRQLTQAKAQMPDVFNYINFRQFLGDVLDYKQAINSSYSANAFIRDAGFSNNSRGYFTHIVNGARNLSHPRIQGFIQACKLKGPAAKYFENLVLFNQSERNEEKKLYFSRMNDIAGHLEKPSFLLLKSQYDYLRKWYIPAIRELIGLDDFENNAAWIAKKLNNDVTVKQVESAIESLIVLGLVKRESDGDLSLVDKVVTFQDNIFNYESANDFHVEILNKSAENVVKRKYEDRSASCVILATDRSNFESIREDIAKFREFIVNKYADKNMKVDSVLCLSLQLNHLTKVEETKS